MSLGVDRQPPPRLDHSTKVASGTSINVEHNPLTLSNQQARSDERHTNTRTDGRRPLSNPDDGPDSAVVHVAGVGPGSQYKVGVTNIIHDFDSIRDMCSRDTRDPAIDLSPLAFAQHRKQTWPSMAGQLGDGSTAHMAPIYEAVRKTGVPNCMGARIPLPSGLNVAAWERYIDYSSDEAELLDMVRYGFPLGYLGPESRCADTPNHSSATNYPEHINDFIREELGHGAVMGPFFGSPFTPWAHTSPLMTREKHDPRKRRVITDLTYPKETSVNAYIFKNMALGDVREHSLPTVTDFVDDLRASGRGSYMFTVDVARAYKNFRLDPLDWPLACIEWDGCHYVDVAMPFGARSSSSNMQRVANFVVRILAGKGIRARMYLDDLVVVAKTQEIANAQYKVVRALLQELGLPEACNKRQPPATKITWLGIVICSQTMSLSIPQEKLQSALEAARVGRDRKAMHRRQLESLVGRLMHIAKCVEPARIFLSRLLQALRDMKDKAFCKVTTDMRADIDWFLEFASEWNGTALIPAAAPTKRIQVDASLTGIGGTDGRHAYGGRVAPDSDPAANITELEAANVIIALHTFLSEADRGSHVLVECDNLPAVQALRWGRGQNQVLMEVARMGWMTQALLDIKITFAHIAGINNTIADALSRGHASLAQAAKTDHLVRVNYLTMVHPCLHTFDNILTCVKSRSGVQLAGTPSRDEAEGGAGSGHTRQLHRDGEGAGRILLPIQDGSHQPRPHPSLHMARVPGGARNIPGDDPQQAVAGQGLRPPGRGTNDWPPPPAGGHGGGRDEQEKGLCPTRQGASTSESTKKSVGGPPVVDYWRHAEGGAGAYILWRHAPVGGGPAVSARFRPDTPSDQGRCGDNRQIEGQGQMGQKHAKIQPTKNYDYATLGRPTHMPRAGGRSGLSTYNGPTSISPTPRDTRHFQAPHGQLPQGCMELCGEGAGHSPAHVWATQHQEGGRDYGAPGRVYRPRNPETWRMDLRCL